MALSDADIRVNCTLGLQVADQIKRAANELRKEFDALHDANEAMRSAWTGANANRFAVKLEETEGQVYAQVKNLKNLAAAIEETVAIYRQEQYELLEKELNSKKGSSSGSSLGDSVVEGGKAVGKNV